MADVCRTRGGALSPLSPNENRKRSRGSSGAQSTWFKRHRTGQSFARRLLHLRGFTLDVRQAEELVRYIDQFPPEMDKDVSSILEKCGDIDDAIRQLTTLRLTAPREGAGGAGAPGGDASANAAGASADRAGLSSDRPADDTAELRSGDAGAPLDTSRETRPGEADGSVSARPAAAEHEARVASEAASAAARLAAAAPTTVSREWVSALVREMSASSDVPDAHARAERVLQAFEATVRGTALASSDAGLRSGGSASLDAETLAKENVILKRAVAIQSARQQEHESTRNQMVELQKLLVQYQERLQNAERQNYSLGIHLKEAMGNHQNSPGMFDRNRDVF